MDRKTLITDLIKASLLNTAQKYLLEDLHEAVKKYVKKCRPTIPKKPSHLAHYTGIQTIYAMITDGQESNEKNAEGKEQIPPGYLRLYDALAFNDPEEGKHMRSEILKNHKWLENAEQDTDTFICSFVSGVEGIGDKAVYWDSSYGRYGLGCAIEIPLEFIQSEDIDFGHVLYEKNDTANFENHFQDYFKLGKRIFTKIDNNKKIELATAFLEKFDAIKFLYKHTGYEEENEYRVIVSSATYKGPVKHALVDKGTRLKRYIEHPALATHRILKTKCKIIIGPRAPDAEYLRRHLEKLTKKIGLLGPKFSLSNIPYRKVW